MSYQRFAGQSSLERLTTNPDDVEIRDDQQGRVLEIALGLEQLKVGATQIGRLPLYS